jgi:hypothetical protein
MYVLFVKFWKFVRVHRSLFIFQVYRASKKLIKTDTKLVESFFAKVSLAANVLFLAG